MPDTQEPEATPEGVETVSTTIRHESVPLVMIDANSGTILRAAGLNQGRLKDYREMVSERLQAAEKISEEQGANVLEVLDYPLPPCRFFYDGDKYWPWDGHHRIEVNKQLGIPVIPGEVREGTRRDAILAACGANEEHGVPRTDADRRKAVVTALQITSEDEIPLSNRAIAEICRVSHTFVNQVKTALEQATGYLHPGTGQSDNPVETVSTAGSDSSEPSTEPVAEQPTVERKVKGKDGKVRDVSANKVPPKPREEAQEKKAPRAKLPEDELSDEAWLKTLPLLGELRVRKVSTEAFANDALAWRKLHLKGVLSEAADGIGRVFDLGAGHATPLEKWAYATARLPHPKDWKVHQCPHKTGSGCEACGGSGYVLRRLPKGESEE